MKRFIIAGATCGAMLAVAAVVAWQLAASPRTRPSRPEQPRGEAKGVRSQVGERREKVERLTLQRDGLENTRMEVTQVAADEGRGEIGVSNSTQSTPSSRTDPSERNELRTVKQYERLDRQFATEDRDPKWARETEEKISATVQTMNAHGLPSARVTASECRLTLCKVTIDTSEALEHQRIPANFSRVGLRTFGTQETTPDGALRWNVFAHRKGYSFPKVEEADLR